MEKANLLKLLKGLLFIGVAILFLLVRFYEIDRFFTMGENVVDLWTQSFTAWRDSSWFDLIWQKTIFNFIFSGLFLIIGVIEIKEAVKRG